MKDQLSVLKEGVGEHEVPDQHGDQKRDHGRIFKKWRKGMRIVPSDSRMDQGAGKEGPGEHVGDVGEQCYLESSSILLNASSTSLRIALAKDPLCISRIVDGLFQ